MHFQITDYANKCIKSCRILARLFALALGQELTYFEKPGFFDNPTCMLGMNYYHFDTLWRLQNSKKQDTVVKYQTCIDAVLNYI